MRVRAHTIVRFVGTPRLEQWRQVRHVLSQMVRAHGGTISTFEIVPEGKWYGVTAWSNDGATFPIPDHCADCIRALREQHIADRRG